LSVQPPHHPPSIKRRKEEPKVEKEGEEKEVVEKTVSRAPSTSKMRPTPAEPLRVEGRLEGRSLKKTKRPRHRREDDRSYDDEIFQSMKRMLKGRD